MNYLLIKYNFLSVLGQTIHAALGFTKTDQHSLTLPNSKKHLIHKYKHLKLVVCDEVSMVSNVQLLEISYRINAIMSVNQKEAILGKTVHFLFVGDLFQLRPVMNDWIFKDLSISAKGTFMSKDKTKKLEYEELSINIWEENVQMYELHEIMRQKDDQPWAKALNLFREGNHGEDEIAMVEEHIYHPKDPYPFTTSHMYYGNADVNQFNKTIYDRTEGDKTQVKANTFVTSDVSKDVKDKILQTVENAVYYQNHKNTGGLVKNLDLCEGLQYDVTCNIDTDDGITNGTSCTLKLIEYRDNFKKPSILWVEFNEAEVGMKYRSQYQHLYSNPLVQKNWTPTFVHRTTFEVSKKTVTRQQFPLVGSAARTFHCCQGKSLQSAVMSMPNTKVPGLHYVGLSRVTKLQNLTILDFNKDKLTVSGDVKKEMKRLRDDRKLELNYTPVYNMNAMSTRVLFHNVTSLHYHMEDLRCDRNYLYADIIGIAESRLNSSDKDETYCLKGFQKIIRNDQKSSTALRPPHGIAIYVRESVYVQQEQHHQTDEIEFSIVTVINKFIPDKTIQLAFVYKSHACNAELLLQTMTTLKSKTDSRYPLAVLGDFNTDPTKMPNIIKKIESILDCKQKQTEYTYIPNEDEKTRIDLVFTNADSTTTGVIDSLFSNHRVVTFQC